jgi:hypothetical protein
MAILLKSGDYCAEDANLSGSVFHNVNLSNAKFDDVNLRGIEFNNVALAGVTIRDACLDNVTIECAGIERMRIEGILVTDMLRAYREKGQFPLPLNRMPNSRPVRINRTAAKFPAWYNLCRPHLALDKKTPAMASGLTDKVWTMRELLERAAEA